MNNINEYIKNQASFISKNVDLIFENDMDCCVLDAMKYSADAGGKRIRPILTLEFSKVCNGNSDAALLFGLAVEMIHTYSLIHDDLPCMDNDDMRRGKPSCHIKFGEDNALLAGDALLTKAFFILSSVENLNSLNIVKAVSVLSNLAGINGMVGGQVLDLQFENNKPDIESIKKMYSLKTCALIKSSCVLGCLTSNECNEKMINAASLYAENLGMAFQIVDDILDIEGDAELFGKPIGSDSKNDKSTVVKYLGIDKSKEYVRNLTNNAIKALDDFDTDCTVLKDIATYLIDRKF